MQISFVLLVIVGAALSAPADPKVRPVLQAIQRTKKSAYGASAPCGGGGYGGGAPVALYLAPQSGIGLGQSEIGLGSHYRNEEEHMMGAEDTEHPQARSYYESGPSIGLLPAGSGLGGAGAGLSLSPAGSAGGPAIGVFPNAKVGGCAVPLLLSCAPSVVSGHIAKHGGYAAPSYGAASYAAPSYKEAEQHHVEMKEAETEKLWSESERAAHLEVPSQGHPLKASFPHHSHSHHGQEMQSHHSSHIHQ